MAEKIEIRALEAEDYYKGFMELLSQLTVAPKIDFEKFKTLLSSLGDKHRVFVIENEEKIIASGAVLFDQKFTRNGGIVAHIEDIVVDENYRKKNLGPKIVRFLIKLAEEKACYKIMLDCAENLVDFYTKIGFKEDSKHMVIYRA